MALLTPSIQTKNTQRYFSIDVLKFIFCILIILYHAKGAFSHLLTHFNHVFSLFFKNQTLIVDCFFIFSGFFLYAYCKKKKSIFNFFKKRILFLYPAILLSFLGLYLFHLYGKVNFLTQENISYIFIYGIFKPILRFNNFDYSWYVFVLLGVSGCFVIVNRILPNKLFNSLIFCLFLINIYFWNKFYILTQEFVKVSVFNVTNLGVVRGIFGISLGYLTGIFAEKYILNLPKKYFYQTSAIEIITFIFFCFLVFIQPIQILKWIIPILCCYLLCLCVYSNGFLTQKLNQIQFSKLGKIAFNIYIFQGIAFLIFNTFFFEILKSYPKYLIFALYIIFPVVFGTIITYLPSIIKCFIIKITSFIKTNDKQNLF